MRELELAAADAPVVDHGKSCSLSSGSGFIGYHSVKPETNTQIFGPSTEPPGKLQPQTRCQEPASNHSTGLFFTHLKFLLSPHIQTQPPKDC
jgi:hypothetical protein